MPNVTVYVKTNWANLPTKTTPIDATNLNHIEQAIENVTNFVNALNASAGLVLCEVAFTNTLKTKLDGIEAQANKYVLPVSTTSVLGGVKVDGSTIIIDQNGVISSVGGRLSTLIDVALDDLTDGQIIKYDAETQKWVNTSEAEVRTQLSLLEDVDLDNLEDGQVLKWDATEEKWVNGEGGDVLSYNETIQVLGQPEDPLNPSNGPFNYSTDEQKVGTYIDGKTLYQRTFLQNPVFQIPKTTDQNIWTQNDSIDASVMESLVNIECKGSNASVFNCIRAYINNSVSPKKIVFQHDRPSSIDLMYITLWYTKTTDQGNNS